MIHIHPPHLKDYDFEEKVVFNHLPSAADLTSAPALKLSDELEELKATYEKAEDSGWFDSRAGTKTYALEDFAWPPGS